MKITLGHVLVLSIICALVAGTDGWLKRNPFRNLFSAWFRQQNRIRQGTAAAPTITTPTPTTTTRPPCVETYGYDESSNWCYGTFCDENGDTIEWDTWNCKPTTSTPSTTTPTPTTISPTTPRGCYYLGQHYPPGQEISRGEDRAANWCWVVYCDKSGNVRHGDDFNCFPTTTQSTTPPSTPSPHHPESNV